MEGDWLMSNVIQAKVRFRRSGIDAEFHKRLTSCMVLTTEDALRLSDSFNREICNEIQNRYGEKALSEIMINAAGKVGDEI